MRRNLVTLLIFLSSAFTFGQTFLVQEDFSSGIPATWQVVDADGYTLHSSMTQFSNAWISYVDGNDTVAASSSYFDDTLYAADYLILPKQTLLTFSKLSWESRTVDPSYPDGYYVLLSTTDSSLTSFTDTLMVVYAENPIWNRKSIWLDTMGYANQDVYIAFQNMTQDGFILLLDDIWLEGSDFAGIATTDHIQYGIYPNPATSFLHIQTDLPVQVGVYDLQGRMLLQSNERKVDVSSLAPGQYIISIRTIEGMSSQPFIKE